jgi:hypothetical protein
MLAGSRPLANAVAAALLQQSRAVASLGDAAAFSAVASLPQLVMTSYKQPVVTGTQQMWQHKQQQQLQQHTPLQFISGSSSLWSHWPHWASQHSSSAAVHINALSEDLRQTLLQHCKQHRPEMYDQARFPQQQQQQQVHICGQVIHPTHADSQKRGVIQLEPFIPALLDLQLPASSEAVPLLCIKRTYQPHPRRYKRKHGFLKR